MKPPKKYDAAIVIAHNKARESDGGAVFCSRWRRRGGMEVRWEGWRRWVVSGVIRGEGMVGVKLVS